MALNSECFSLLKFYSAYPKTPVGVLSTTPNIKIQHNKKYYNFTKNHPHDCNKKRHFCPLHSLSNCPSPSHVQQTLFFSSNGSISIHPWRKVASEGLFAEKNWHKFCRNPFEAAGCICRMKVSFPLPRKWTQLSPIISQVHCPS